MPSPFRLVFFLGLLAGVALTVTAGELDAPMHDARKQRGDEMTAIVKAGNRAEAATPSSDRTAP